LAAAVAQVIELGAAHGPAALDLDGLDHRREHRKHALDAFAEADLADGEVLLQAGGRPLAFRVPRSRSSSSSFKSLGFIALCLLIGEMRRPQVRPPLPRG